MADAPNTITVTVVFDYSAAASSHWVSMAEAALDYAWPSWRTLPPDERKSAKETMMETIWAAADQNPAGARNGVTRESPFKVRAIK